MIHFGLREAPNIFEKAYQISQLPFQLNFIISPRTREPDLIFLIPLCVNHRPY
jgi:hypothetical protein